MHKIICSLCMCAFLFGCATDPYAGERKVSKTAIGTGIGAISGAGIGALIGGEKGAMIGAAPGALLGVGTGAYMDVQAQKLRQKLVGTGVQVVEEDGKVYLIMPGNITFNTNDDVIKTSFEGVLDSVAVVIKEYDKTLVLVRGFTDNTGSDALNNTLSYQRAVSVANYLRLQGVSSERIMAQGYGSRNPIASNTTPEGRAQNRRVEIVLVNQIS